MSNVSKSMTDWQVWSGPMTHLKSFAAQEQARLDTFHVPV